MRFELTAPFGTASVDKAKIMERLQKVLAFADANLGRLDTLTSFWKEDSGDPMLRLVDKVVIECALMVMLVSRIDHLPPELDHLVFQIKEKLARHILTERNRILLMRFPKLSASLGAGIIFLHEMGVTDPDLYALVKKGLDENFPETAERSPFRMMDVRWVRWLVYPQPPPGFVDLVQISILGSKAHPIYMDNADAYAVTHSLMYITDFGRCPQEESFSSFDFDHVSQMIDNSIAWHIMSEDIDLLGEFLIDAALLGRFMSPYAQFAWFMINKVWDELGFLPGPGFIPSDFARLSGDEASAYAFQYLYHTNFVGGILCAVLLGGLTENTTCDFIKPSAVDIQSVIERCETANQRIKKFLQKIREDNRPGYQLEEQQRREKDALNFKNPNVSSESSPFEKVVEHGLSLSGIAGKPKAPWIRCIVDAPLMDQELLLVLSDALLIQAAREYNLALVSNVLKDTVDQNLSVTYTFLETVTFLAMQQLESGAVGAQFLHQENLKPSQMLSIAASFTECFTQTKKHLTLFL